MSFKSSLKWIFWTYFVRLSAFFFHPNLFPFTRNLSCSTLNEIICMGKIELNEITFSFFFSWILRVSCSLKVHKLCFPFPAPFCPFLGLTNAWLWLLAGRRMSAKRKPRLRAEAKLFSLSGRNFYDQKSRWNIFIQLAHRGRRSFEGRQQRFIGIMCWMIRRAAKTLKVNLN